MFKKLDILIIRSFIGPFVVTFFVTLFVLVMQFFWLYMDELIGKGLGVWMITQLLVFMSTTMVPMALPLSILLSSIMTFGNMGENFELVAIKSSGISLLRFMRPLLLFIILIGALGFVFNNNVIPVANLKALSLLYDLRNSKPTFNIRPGLFNKEIEGYSIRVGSKDKDGQTIRNILIYDHTGGLGNDKVIIANSGQMVPSPDKQYLIFKLNNGWRYQEGYKNGVRSEEQTRMYFRKWDKVFDLSSFKLSRTNQDLFKGAYQMMNVAQLGESIDSFKKGGLKIEATVNKYISPYITFYETDSQVQELTAKMQANTVPVRPYDSSFAKTIANDSVRKRVIDLALSNIRNVKGLVGISANDKYMQKENLLKFQVEWHRKFTLSFACVLLFLIGAPLGAIIRKGGLGMPLVIAVVFFIFFHFTSITGEKLAKSGSLSPWMGMWMSTVILLPIAFLLINQARNDSQIFSKEWYIRLWRGIKTIISRK